MESLLRLECPRSALPATGVSSSARTLTLSPSSVNRLVGPRASRMLVLRQAVCLPRGYVRAQTACSASSVWENSQTPFHILILRRRFPFLRAGRSHESYRTPFFHSTQS